MKSQTKRALLVLSAYFFLTILMTWPTAAYLTTGIPGDGFDGWQNYWNLWWVKQALLVQGTTPYFTNVIYPPTGASLLFHTLNIFNSLWTFPLQLNFGLTVAYNSVVFGSFVLAGFGAYLLALYTLTKLFPGHNSQPSLHLAAFVGGLVFTMSPFHMAHLLGHMQVFSMIWPPFYVLWLLRILDPWATSLTSPPRRWRNAALTCLFLILATLVALYHTLYLLIFTGLVLLWTIIRRWLLFKNTHLPTPTSQAIQPLITILAIGLGFAIVLSPLLIPLISNAGNRPDLETGLFQNITLSADLLGYITPSEMHPLWGAWATGIANNFTTTTSERLIFAGFIPLALSLFIVVRRWKSIIIKFWTFITLTFVILSFGPYLHSNGQIVTLGGWPLPMPYLFLYYSVPFINLTRSLSRYDLMVMMGLGVLVPAALIQIELFITNYQSAVVNPKPGLSEAAVSKIWTERPTQGVDSRSSQNLKSNWVSLLVAALILFEFLPIPYPISPVDTPQFYHTISTDGDDYTIAELPMNWDRPTPLLHQTTHGKKVLTVYTSRNNPLELAWRTPVLQQWRTLGPDIINQPLDQIAPTIFFDFNLRYIVLDYWQMPPGPERDSTEHWVAAALPNIAPVYDDGRLKVYQTPPKTDTQPYLTLGNGWSDRQIQDDGSVQRVLTGSQPTELFLHHSQNQRLTLIFNATSNQPTGQSLTIVSGNEALGTVQLSQTQSQHSVSIPPSTDPLVKLQLTPNPKAGAISVSQITIISGNTQ